jgi:hypothetical protein
MDHDAFDFNLLMQQRRAAAEESFALADPASLPALIERLFPAVDHPWRQRFEEFLAAHPDSPVAHGTTSDGVEFVYYPRENKGLWYHFENGVRSAGPIGERGLSALAEIALEKGVA